MRISDVVGRSIARVRAYRLAAELVVLTVIGLLMGILQPLGSGAAPTLLRYAYWLICVVAGGAVGIACDGVLGRLTLPLWQRVQWQGGRERDFYSCWSVRRCHKRHMHAKS